MSIQWRCQFHERQDGSGRQSADLLHFASTGFGFAEIYDDGETFLLSLPRKFNRPAELFDSLRAAKRAVNRAIIDYKREGSDG